MIDCEDPLLDWNGGFEKYWDRGYKSPMTSALKIVLAGTTSINTVE